MNIILIDDTNKTIFYVREAIASLTDHFRNLTLVDTVPFPVYENTYSEALRQVSQLSGESIVLLDLKLSLESPPETIFSGIAGLTPEETRTLTSVVGGDLWQGLLIGREAIFNQQLRPLVISIASSAGAGRCQQYLEEIVLRTRDRRVVIQDLRGALDSSDQARACLVSALRQKTESNALVRVWERTASWFSSLPVQYLTEKCVPHTLTKGHNWTAYREVFENVFGFELHSQVWGRFESVYALHEVLKTLVGMHYCGNSYAGEGKNNLSCGAMYLLILLAESTLEPDPALRKWRDAVRAFDEHPYFVSPLFAVQPPEVARRAALGLFSLLTTLLKPEAKHGNSKVEDIRILGEGRGLQVLFSLRWQTSAFSKWVEGIHGDKDSLVAVWFGEKEPERLRECLGAIWRSQATSKHGFGAPGSIWMEHSKLTFYSVAGKRITPEEQGGEES